MKIVEFGVYHIADQFFIDFPDPYLKGNKQESRPHYCCFKDNKTEIFWMIPFSSQQAKIALAHKKFSEGKIDIFHFTDLDGRSGVLIIHDMFPVLEKYVVSPYCISGQPVVFKNNYELKQITRKATKVLRLLRKGVVFTPTQPNVFKIEQALLEELGLTSSKTN